MAAWLLGEEQGRVLKEACLLYQRLTQVLRLCVTGPYDPKRCRPASTGSSPAPLAPPISAPPRPFLATRKPKWRQCFPGCWAPREIWRKFGDGKHALFRLRFREANPNEGD